MSIPTEPAEIAANTPRVSLDRARGKVLIPRDERSARRILGLWLGSLDFVLVLVVLVLLGSPPGKSTVGVVRLLPYAAFFGVLWIGLYSVGAYRRHAISQGLHTLTLVSVGLLAGFLALLAYKIGLATLKDGPPVYRFTALSLLMPIGIAGWVTMSRKITGWFLRRSEALARILVLRVGSEPIDHIRKLIAERLSQAPVLIFSLEPTENELPLEFFSEHLSGAVRCVVLASGFESLPASVVEDLVHARLMDVPTHTPTDLTEELLERTPLANADYRWVTSASLHACRSNSYLAAKRFIDLGVSLIGIAMTWWIMILVAIAVKTTSRGPIFFTQVREGRWKKPFAILKFRTMTTDAEKNGAQWASANDPRVTSIGAFLRKSRLDELPQFFNVLLGDMSLVGPRPERPEFNRMLEERLPWYDLRHLVKPGLTGWAQVRYPYGASVEDALAKLEYEIYYVKNASLHFDFRVLFRTFAIVFGLRGR